MNKTVAAWREFVTQTTDDGTLSRAFEYVPPGRVGSVVLADDAVPGVALPGTLSLTSTELITELRLLRDEGYLPIDRLNREVAGLTLKHVLTYPEEHSQITWTRTNECGTVACLAGRTCIVAGWDDEDPSLWHADVALRVLGVINDDVKVDDWSADVGARWVYDRVFLNLDERFAIETFAAVFGLDPNTGDLIEIV
jgi:hypothetical protein